MAEANKSGIFAKAQKRISRTKTKVLQTLGKAEKYTDETFDDLVQRTEKQHDVAHHLQKEIKSYVSCMRALSNASKSLAAALGTTYEEEWTDEMGFKKMLEAQDLLWTDYLDSVQNCVMEPMNKYLATFPPLKVRTAKRGRKMMDFDNARHNLEVLQAAKKRDEAKIAKAQEELNESKQIFEELHSELCTELPNFYNSRVTFYADLFQKLFTCENTLHTELARISQGLNDTSEKLSKDHVQFVYTPKRPLSKSLSDNSDEQPLNGDSSPRPGTGTGTDSPASSASPAATPTTPTAVPRPSPAPVAASAGGGGGVGVSVKEEQEDGDGEDDDHVYGNQDAVAAAKVNGDVDSAPKSESPPPPTPPPQEETTTPASAPAVESAFAEEGCLSDPSALADDSLAVRSPASAPLPAVVAPCVEECNSSALPLYLTPVPAAPVALPPCSVLSLPVPSPVHVEGRGSPVTGAQQVGGAVAGQGTALGPAQGAGHREEVETSVEEKAAAAEGESQGTESGAAALQECGDVRKASSADSHMFIDTSYQQEIDTALGEEDKAKCGVQAQPGSVKKDQCVDTLLTEDARSEVRAEPHDSKSVVEGEGVTSSESTSTPNSITSDFDTLADTTSERKGHAEPQHPAQHPDQREAAGWSDEVRVPRPTGDQKDPGLPGDRPEGAAGPASSKASSEFLITSSFSDVSSATGHNLHSPVGEVYDNITFSSQEDLQDQGARNRDAGDLGSKLTASMSAEEKSVISALEQAIRSASSPDPLAESEAVLVEGSYLKPEQCTHVIDIPPTSIPNLVVSQESWSQDEGLYESIMPLGDDRPPDDSKGGCQAPDYQTCLTEGFEDGTHLYRDSGVQTTSVPCIPTPPKDPLTGVMLKPPVFLISPYTVVPHETPEERMSPKKGSVGEESKKSLSHKGFDMVRSMLHLTSRVRATGQKSGAKATKSVDSPERSVTAQSEDTKKRKRSSPGKSPSMDTKNFKRKVCASPDGSSAVCEEDSEGTAAPRPSPEENRSPAEPKCCKTMDENFPLREAPPSPEGFKSGQVVGGVGAEGMWCVGGPGQAAGDRSGPQGGGGQQPAPSSPQASSPGVTHNSHTAPDSNSAPPTEPLPVAALRSAISGVHPSGPKSSGRTLNPLAPPFRMPASAIGPQPVTGAGVNPSFSFSLPRAAPPASELHSLTSHPNPSITGLAHATVDGREQMTSSSEDPQQNYIPQPYAVPASKAPTDGRKEDSFPLRHRPVNRNSLYLRALQHAFHGRRTQSSQQPGANKRFPPATFTQQGWHPSTHLSPTFRTPQFSLDGWGQEHGGDVAMGTASSLPGVLQESVMKGEVERMAMTHGPGVGLDSHPGKVSKLGDGDVIRQVSTPAPGKPLLVSATHVADIPQPAPSHNQEGPKASPQITPGRRAADAAFDLDVARETWRKAWRASSIPDNTATEQKSGNDKQESPVQTVVSSVPQADNRSSKHDSQGTGVTETSNDVHLYENVAQPLSRNMFSTSVEDCKADTEKDMYVTLEGNYGSGKKTAGTETWNKGGSDVEDLSCGDQLSRVEHVSQKMETEERGCGALARNVDGAPGSALLVSVSQDTDCQTASPKPRLESVRDKPASGDELTGPLESLKPSISLSLSESSVMLDSVDISAVSCDEVAESLDEQVVLTDEPHVREMLTEEETVHVGRADIPCDEQNMPVTSVSCDDKAVFEESQHQSEVHNTSGDMAPVFQQCSEDMPAVLEESGERRAICEESVDRQPDGAEAGPDLSAVQPVNRGDVCRGMEDEVMTGVTPDTCTASVAAHEEPHRPAGPLERDSVSGDREDSAQGSWRSAHTEKTEECADLRNNLSPPCEGNKPSVSKRTCRQPGLETADMSRAGRELNKMRDSVEGESTASSKSAELNGTAANVLVIDDSLSPSRILVEFINKNSVTGLLSAEEHMTTSLDSYGSDETPDRTLYVEDFENQWNQFSLSSVFQQTASGDARSEESGEHQGNTHYTNRELIETPGEDSVTQRCEDGMNHTQTTPVLPVSSSVGGPRGGGILRDSPVSSWRSIEDELGQSGVVGPVQDSSVTARDPHSGGYTSPHTAQLTSAMSFGELFDTQHHDSTETVSVEKSYPDAYEELETVGEREEMLDRCKPKNSEDVEGSSVSDLRDTNRPSVFQSLLPPEGQESHSTETGERMTHSIHSLDSTASVQDSPHEGRIDTEPRQRGQDSAGTCECLAHGAQAPENHSHVSSTLSDSGCISSLKDSLPMEVVSYDSDISTTNVTPSISQGMDRDHPASQGTDTVSASDTVLLEEQTHTALATSGQAPQQQQALHQHQHRTADSSEVTEDPLRAVDVPDDTGKVDGDTGRLLEYTSPANTSLDVSRTDQTGQKNMEETEKREAGNEDKPNTKSVEGMEETDLEPGNGHKQNTTSQNDVEKTEIEPENGDMQDRSRNKDKTEHDWENEAVENRPAEVGWHTRHKETAPTATRGEDAKTVWSSSPIKSTDIEKSVTKHSQGSQTLNLTYEVTDNRCSMVPTFTASLAFGEDTNSMAQNAPTILHTKKLAFDTDSESRPAEGDPGTNWTAQGLDQHTADIHTQTETLDQGEGPCNSATGRNLFLQTMSVEDGTEDEARVMTGRLMENADKDTPNPDRGNLCQGGDRLQVTVEETTSERGSNPEDHEHEHHQIKDDVEACSRDGTQHQKTSEKQEETLRDDPALTDGSSPPRKEDWAQRDSRSEGEESEGFEVTGAGEEDSLYPPEDEWGVEGEVERRADRQAVPPRQAKARSVYNTHNGPQSTGDAEGGNVYEVPPKGGEEEEEEDSEDEDGAVYQSPPSNKPVYEAPPSTLYQVEATHAYCGEDIDELSFDPGDIIYVVPFENEDEQDEGWQMGIKQRDGLKGVFPENFTRRL